MKTLKTSLIIVAFLSFSCLWAQERQKEEKEEDKKVIKEVDKINRASDEINATAANTSTAVKSTVANTKETVKAVASLFGTGKKKEAKVKGSVTITIVEVDYDNDYLTKLYNHIAKYKGVKKPAKTFSNGQAAIKVSYKESADALWQGVPKEVRKGFKMLQMDNQLISLKFAGNQFDNN